LPPARERWRLFGGSSSSDRLSEEAGILSVSCSRIQQARSEDYALNGSKRMPLPARLAAERPVYKSASAASSTTDLAADLAADLSADLTAGLANCLAAGLTREPAADFTRDCVFRLAMINISF